MTSGIYIIKAPSGGQYIGSAVNLRTRWNHHRHNLKKGVHYNRALQRACYKYGLENMIFAKLLICRKEDLLFFEQRAIDILKPRYNACLVAGSQLGRKHSTESNFKNALAHKGKVLTKEHRARISASLQGKRFPNRKPPSTATRAKISKTLTGSKHKDGFESSVTLQQRLVLVDSYISGKSLCWLASKFHTGRHVVKRIILAQGVTLRPKGYNPSVIPSEETKRKISASLTGKKHSPEREAKRFAAFTKTIAARKQNQVTTPLGQS